MLKRFLSPSKGTTKGSCCWRYTTSMEIIKTLTVVKPFVLKVRQEQESTSQQSNRSIRETRIEQLRSFQLQASLALLLCSQWFQRRRFSTTVKSQDLFKLKGRKQTTLPAWISWAKLTNLFLWWHSKTTWIYFFFASCWFLQKVIDLCLIQFWF